MTESSTPKEPRRQILGIDPGMATLIAAVLALVGTVLTLLVQMPRGSGQTPTPGSSIEGVVTTPTAIVPALPSGESTPTGSPANPTFSVVSALAPEARATAVVAGRALRDLSLQLPLVVRDEFDNNDYGWSTGTTDYADGVSCTTTLTSGALELTVVSGRTFAYCFNGLQRTVSDFAFDTELSIPGQRGAEVGVLWGAAEKRMSVITNPLSRTVAVYHGDSLLLAPTIVDEIDASGSNRVHLLVLGNNVALYLNDTLSITGSDLPDPGEGPLSLWARLNEPNQQITLSTGRLELRGS